MEFVQERNSYIFTAKDKMPSGMTTEINFFGYFWDNQRTAEFLVVLDVYKKRKDKPNIFLKRTGKDGLKTLLFAKKAIKEFEPYIIEQYGRCHQKMFINIQWTDNKRRDIYYRGLKDIGYKFTMFNGSKVLSKRIK